MGMKKTEERSKLDGREDTRKSGRNYNKKKRTDAQTTVVLMSLVTSVRKNIK